jgi:ABC-type nitrate/sulfonate/bicarbonate transport system permease component
LNAALRPRLVQAGFLFAIVAVWQVVSGAHAVSPLVLPPLAAIGTKLAALLVGGGVWFDLGITVMEVVAAFALAAAAGCAAGYAISRSRYAVRVFDPLLAALYAVPAILLYPLYLLFFGIGPVSKIAIAATIAFFPIVLSTIAGLANVQRSLIVAARSMGASDWQLFADVMLPAAFPVVLTGLRLGLVISLLATLGAETLSSFDGVGHRISAFAENLETASMYAWVVVAIVLAAGLNACASLVERRGRGMLM